jgi:hypothetical protein
MPVMEEDMIDLTRVGPEDIALNSGDGSGPS